MNVVEAMVGLVNRIATRSVAPTIVGCNMLPGGGDAVRRDYSSRLPVSFALAISLLASACSTAPKYDPQAYAPTLPPPPVPVEQRQGAIYHESIGLSLFEDTRARRVGDLITVILVEKTSASKKAGTTTEKKGDITMPNPTLFGQSVGFNNPFNKSMDLNLGQELHSDQSFEGKGDSSLSNALNGQITVTVAEVLSNGYLVVRGEKRLTINQGDEYVQIAGIVRPSDVQSDNTVLSTLVADARISYTGDGDVNDASQMGMLARFFNKLWPY